MLNIVNHNQHDNHFVSFYHKRIKSRHNLQIITMRPASHNCLHTVRPLRQQSLTAYTKQTTQSTSHNGPITDIITEYQHANGQY